MNRPVRIGVQIQPQHADYAEIRRAVAAAEEAVGTAMAGDGCVPGWVTAVRTAP